ncbi:MAG: phage major capsid protein, partial [Solirubrobacteraceae bacterium]
SAAWEGVFLNSEELASITPIPESVLDDSSFDVWGEVQEAVGQSIAQKIDNAIFSGVEKPATWPAGLIAGAVAAGNAITADSTAAEGGMVNDLANLLGVVEADGFEPSSFAASRALKPLLRSARSTTGEPLLGDQFTLDNVWSTPVAYAVAGTMGSSLALAGDFRNCAVIGIRQDVTYKVLSEASIVDDTGKVILALAQQDSVALRVVMRLAFAVGTPATLTDAASGTPFPFAVLNPGPPVGVQASRGATAKK